MRVIFCILLSLAVSTCVFAEDIIKKTETFPDGSREEIYYLEDTDTEVARRKIDNKGYILRKTGRIPNATVKELYESGKLHVSAQYKDERLHGIRQTFWEDGQVMVESHWQEGQPQGVNKMYYQNGQMLMEWKYVDGKLDGVSKNYYKDGSLRIERRYEKDKLKDTTLYYQSGGTRLIQLFRDGKLVNEKRFDESGNQISEENYLN